MLGMKEICALLIAGGMGAGSVVTVQKVRTPVTKAGSAKPRPQGLAYRPARTPAHRAAPRPAPRSDLLDCPVSATSLSAGQTDLALLPPDVFGPFQLVPPNVGGGSGPINSGPGGSSSPTVRPDPIPIVPGIPQPDSWVLMVAGFGFIGLAMRRSGSSRRKISA